MVTGEVLSRGFTLPRFISRRSSSRQKEVDGYFCFYLDGFVVQHVRTVAPLPDSINRCGGKHGMAADHDQVFDCPGFTDDGAQLNRSLYTRLACQCRIDGLDAVKEISLRQMRYQQGLDDGGRLRDRNRQGITQASWNIAWCAT